MHRGRPHPEPVQPSFTSPKVKTSRAHASKQWWAFVKVHPWLSVSLDYLTKSSKQFHGAVTIIVPTLQMSQIRFRVK